MSVRVLLSTATLLALLCAGAPVSAQTPDTARVVRGRLVLIAGADLHLELSGQPLLVAGDTLVVGRAPDVRGELVVVAADSARAVVRFRGTPFPLTRGAVLEAELRRGSVSPAVPAAGAPAAGAPPAPAPGVAADVPATPPDSAANAGQRRPHLQASGYFTSETRWIQQHDGDGTESFGIPASTLTLRVDNLPGSASLQVYAHAEHYGGGARLVPGSATQVRVYTARLESQAGPLRIGLGRMTSLHDPVGGPWDGVSLETDGQVGVVAAAGFEPERGTGVPTTRFPRLMLSAHARGAAGETDYRGTVSALRYLADAPAERGRLALSTRHWLRTGALSVSGDVVAESTDSGSLALRWGGVRAALGGSGGGSVHVTYRRYQPYRFGAGDTLGEATAGHRLEAGGYVPFGRTVLSVSAATVPGADSRTLGVASHLYVHALPAELELDVSGGVWRRAELHSMHAGVGVARAAGRVHTRAAYRLERGAERDPVLAHELTGELSLLVGRRSWIGAYGMHSSAGAVAGTQLELRLTWGF